MARTVTKPWDPAEHLTSEDDMVAYLDAALALQRHASPAGDKAVA